MMGESICQIWVNIIFSEKTGRKETDQIEIGTGIEREKKGEEKGKNGKEKKKNQREKG